GSTTGDLRRDSGFHGPRDSDGGHERSYAFSKSLCLGTTGAESEAPDELSRGIPLAAGSCRLGNGDLETPVLGGFKRVLRPLLRLRASCPQRSSSSGVNGKAASSEEVAGRRRHRFINTT